MASQSFNLNLNINANATSVQNQLKNLQKQLQDISNMKIDLGTSNLTADIEKASEAAMKLSAHLATATNPQTGNLDFTKFYTSIQKSGASLQEYGQALQNMGPAGQKAFVNLADSISKAEIPLKRTNKLVDGMWDNLKKTVGWQISSSMVHGFIGSMQQAVGYAKDLNKSLTDIRIVTGASTDQMAQFAKQANQAAKNLSTTTTDYTKASLIYYQQGLSDQEVKARTETTIKMANATGTSAQKVSDQMTAIWNNFDNGTKSLTHYADVMTALGAATASSTDEIAQGLQKFASISDTVGLSYEYAASALATITSTSRESADVVGNSLKTLFSRIQGLQLGETLDDGTTLNKYSTAMAKVGISIKDASGDLKSMDSILDEMGNKWQTLASDEKMALAQTVAGVRQYTQLMTLMENWDQFKSNLNIANTSAGTLDAQANIYAQSWEAASNRVRAAWEGLWDNMIDSDSAVEVLDFVSKMVNGLDSMLTSLGGAKGVLTTFGGLLTKIFAPKISESIADTAYNIGMMLPGAQKRAEQRRKDMLTDLQGAMASGHLDMGSYESRIRNSTISARLKESQNQSERERMMTDEEKLWDREYAKQLERNRELQVQNAQEIDAAANTRANLAIDDIGLDKLDSMYTTGGQLYRDMASAEERAYSDKNLSNETREKAFQDAVNAEKQYYAKGRKEASQTGKTVREMFNETFNQNKDFFKSFDTNDIEKAKKSIEEFAEKTGQSVEDLDKRLGEFATDEDKKAFLDQYAKKLANQNRDNMINDMDIDASEEGLTIEELDQHRQKYRDYFDKLAEIEAKKQRGEELSDQEKAIIANRDKLGSKKVNWSDAFVGASQGLWASVAALEALKSFANDPSLLSLAGLVGNSVEAFDGFNTLFKAFPGSIGKFSSALSLGMMAFIAAFDLIGEALDKWDNRFQRSAEQAATSAQELQTAYSKNQSSHTQLLNIIEEYKQSESKLRDISLSSKERADAEYEHNRMVANMIGEYNLQEGEYSRVGGQLEVSQEGLDRITQESSDRVNASRAAADQGAVNAKEKANEAEVARLREQMTEAGGKDGDIGNTLLKIGGGLLIGAGVAALATIAAPALAAAGGAIAAGMGASGAMAGLGLGGALGAGVLGSSSLGSILAGAGIAGAGSMLLGARAEQDFEKANFADQALKITEEKKGDTSWLNSIDSIMSEGFSEDRAKIIYQYRDSLEQLSSSMKAAELAGDAVAENAARNVVATNEAANASEQQSKIVEGATTTYEKAYSEQKEQLTKTFDGMFANKKDKFDEAEMAREALGLSDLQGFEWEDDDKSNRRLTYSYIDESGKVQQGAVSYDSVIEAQASKTGTTAVNAYTDQALEVFDTMKGKIGEKGASGLLSLLTGGDFESATVGEINKAKEAIQEMAKDGITSQEIQEMFGMDQASLEKAFNIPEGTLDQFLTQFENYESPIQSLLGDNKQYQEWAAKNGDIVNAMSQKTAKQLYSNLTQITATGGEEAGNQFLWGLTNMLKTTGLNENDFGAALERLMAIDWTSWEAGDQAAQIINSLGGTLDTCSASWQNFANAMRAAAGAIPDFSAIISQITQLLGLLGSAEIGDTLDASSVESLLAKYPDFADIVMKQYDGSYKLSGDPEKYIAALQQEASDAYAKTMANKASVDKYFGAENGQGQRQGGIFNGTEFEGGLANLEWADLVKASGSKTGVYSDLMGFARETTGIDAQDIINAETSYNEAKTALDAFVAENMKDGEIVGAEKGTSEYIDLENQYNQLLMNYQNAKAVQDNMIGSLQNIASIDYDLATTEGKEMFASTFNSASKVMDAVNAGNAMMVDGNGIISDAAMDQLKTLPETSERATAALEALAFAKEQLELNPDDDAAQAAYDEALANYDLAQAIDAVAAARGLDAEAVAFHAEQLNNSLSKEDKEKMTGSQIADMAADLAEQQQAVTDLNKAWSNLSRTLSKDELTLDKGKALKELGKYLDGLTNSTTFANKSFETLNKGYKKFLKEGGDMSKVLKGNRKEITKLARCMSDITEEQFDWAESQRDSSKELADGAKVADTYQGALDIIDSGMSELKSEYDGGFLTADDLTGGQATLDSVKQAWMDIYNSCRAGGMSVADAMAETAAQTGLEGYVTAGEASSPDANTSPDGVAWGVEYECADCGHGYMECIPKAVSETIPGSQQTSPSIDNLELVPKGDAPKGTPTGGGGGGGGGAKEPKKVANKRKSSIVKRYKKIDFKRGHAEKATKSEENKKDYLYGEKKIAQMEKINLLAQKEARITADRIKESREYLVEDRQNLIKYMQKYGFEAEFDADGFLANYEKVWNEIYKEIAALYEDNELTEEESKLEEDLNIKLEELEGALEDYENSLSELLDDIEAYEESLFEMYDNKIEALEHKVEFKIELEEDDLEYLDFWIDALGDSVYNAIESIEAIGAKANMLFNGLDVYKQGIEDIYALSDDPFQIWATGGLEDVLTQDQVDLLRDNRDGLADFMQQLIDLREDIKDKVIDTFDLWQERIDANITSLEHYTSVLEHFKNIVDTVGKDPFGLSDEFVNAMEQSAINQSMDGIEANKAYYESLQEQQLKAQEELNAARERGDESSAEHWEEVVRTTAEAVEEAQDAMLSSLNDTLTMIAEQFEAAMQRAVDAFNDAIYTYGGLEGLSADYDMIRENADLMAADYEKIYELSKLTRDINKVLDDTNIVAGKKKMNSLLKEINELQADGVELSKYDLEYLRAKYELRLAEIELENTQNQKDTVRLSKDSEGNWSYVYTQNENNVEEAEQKYEDALYEMQNLSQEYLEEMSGMMIETSQAMMEEISALRIQDFTSYEAYQTEIKRIQDKYAQSLRFQEDELNKSIQNSSDLYEQDWQAYNQATGYKISLAENWVDSFREATLGDILDIDTFMSGFSDTFLGLTEQMSESLAGAAIQYFENVDTALNKYGTSIDGFNKTITTTMDNISTKSKDTTTEIKTMSKEMADAFEEIADYVSGWQEEFSGQIDTMLEEIRELIQSINEAIRKSAELAGEKDGAGELIGSAEAIELLNATGQFGSWSSDGGSGVRVDGKATNFIDYNAALIEEIDEAVARYANAKTGTEERERLGEELKELFKRYWQYRDIVNRVYDPTNLTTNMDAPTFTSMDTGGYTGEWGNSGKLAMLHEKELVLNAEDTRNFLDALNISKDVINSMIEMNARASGLALGDLFPSLVQDFGQTLEQTVTITAEFPEATDRNEIEEAFNNLLNTASQYANRNNI